MKIQLYKNRSQSNVLNKDLELLRESDIRLKADVSNINPVLILSRELVEGANYCYIDGLERFYFIDTIHQMNNRLVRVELRIDVLETYRDLVMTLGGKITKPIEEGDYGDIQVSSPYDRDWVVLEGSTDLDLKSSLIFTTVGGV